MQTIHPESETGTPQTVANASPQARSTEQARIYAQEVRSLRQRVAVLEAELAAAKAAEQLSKTPPLTSISFAPTAVRATKPAPVLSHRVAAVSETTSLFTEQVAPAVVSAIPDEPVTPAEPTQPATAPATGLVNDGAVETAQPESNPGFAQAWGQEPDATFAEKVAEKAFFEASSIDEESRSWLLNS